MSDKKEPLILKVGDKVKILPSITTVGVSENFVGITAVVVEVFPTNEVTIEIKDQNRNVSYYCLSKHLEKIHHQQSTNIWDYL